MFPPDGKDHLRKPGSIAGTARRDRAGALGIAKEYETGEDRNCGTFLTLSSASGESHDNAI